MIQVRRSKERGHAQHGWLDSHHTFSFADYYDPQFMGVGPLRVINEDRISGGTGFDTHGHRDMEIISYVIDGALRHKDSMGNETIIKPGEVQRMTAGTGVLHSEYNARQDSKTHFLQIWIRPEVIGLTPGYDQKQFFDDSPTCTDFKLVVSKNGRDGSVSIHQDVDIYAAKATAPGQKKLTTYPHRKIWIQVVKGQVKTHEQTLNAGDGAEMTNLENIDLEWTGNSEFLVFDLPVA